ncbi:hypothetical protein BDY21DRAFT_383129 [Lineolata rhizophorae]|uniref:DNA ligase n=1 Tax=Lineolata rhizophorae TaxID=578093 RepID=A0A6A6PE24_9PEZI|nr:hypothetical protein BDY21DRAFT_383129 [Lineolata rhizophorae]
MAADVTMQSAEAAEEEEMQYGHGNISIEELGEKFPNRPHNHSRTLPFSSLFLTLFNPLNDNKKKPTATQPPLSRKKRGPHGPTAPTPYENRRNIIQRFIARWRSNVGNDIYPAFRLIVPEKDRDRPMYGLKEKTIGKLLVRVLRIDKDSADGRALANWKLPGRLGTAGGRYVPGGSAGDFGARCFEVVGKRAMRTEPGDLTIGEVNAMLDRLAAAAKEEEQLPVFEEFYRRMNAEEIMWLVRMILRQMKIGASERTLFQLWHPDAESLFSVSSSLRRVCWELYDPAVRLDGEDRGIKLMQCFQPQLAAFQMHSLDKMVGRMLRTATEEDDEFWIEEKLDGERMQLHMVEEDSAPGGFRLGFWSRKAKDYTYLYGSSFEDESSALARHIRPAFSAGVRNLILDGEMITWDVDQGCVAPFGTLKTAALAEKQSSNVFDDNTGQRPVYRVFDCLYLNDTPLTQFTLRDRRAALAASVSDIHRRIEVHPYTVGQTAADIETALRRVVAESSEGLVVKSPRSAYILNARTDDWIKVKPEYMTAFGEALDCVVVGGYYGSGHRGGTLSSFLCGLRVKDGSEKCFSFFKVGGGLKAADYAAVRARTDAKWKTWDPKRPPSEFVELGGGAAQLERPDVWIRPSDSVVLEVKAASVAQSDSFRAGLTLRFPRFKRLRDDKSWEQALSVDEFIQLKEGAEREGREKEFEVDTWRKRKNERRTRKRPLVIAGEEGAGDEPAASGKRVAEATAAEDPEVGDIFKGLTFHVLSDAVTPKKMSKDGLETFIKAHGGRIVARPADQDTVCIADRRLPKVVALMQTDRHTLVRPAWLFDCVAQAAADARRSAPTGTPPPRLLLPWEPVRHLFFVKSAERFDPAANVDVYGDSYARDVDVDELMEIFRHMPKAEDGDELAAEALRALEEEGIRLEEIKTWLFKGCVVWFAYGDEAEAEEGEERRRVRRANWEVDLAETTVKFAGGKVVRDVSLEGVTHVVFGRERGLLDEVKRALDGLKRPHIVSLDWVTESWKEGTLIDEDRFTIQK